MKIGKIGLNFARALKGLQPVSKNKINARWVFWVFKICRFFDVVCQVETVAETFYVLSGPTLKSPIIM